MPGIELLDYVQGDHITATMRDQIIEIVHDTLDFVTGTKPAHSNFRYSTAGYLDTSGYDYILVVDGEENQCTTELKKEIRTIIKEKVAELLDITEEQIAVRYRLHNSSFG